MKRTLLLLLPVLFLLTACGTVLHAGFSGADGTVRLDIHLGGPQYADLVFTLNGTEYTVASAPTVGDPSLILCAKNGHSLVLDLPASTHAEAKLHLPAENGSITEYTCPAEKLRPLLDWMRTN